MVDQFNLENFLPYLLNQAAEVASARFAKVYRERYGMQRTDWRVLAHLGQWGAMSATEICNRAKEEKTRISRAVARLEDKGWLVRVSVQTDRRRENLDLTEEGHKIYADLSAEAYVSDQELVREIGVDAARALRDALVQIATQQPTN